MTAETDTQHLDNARRRARFRAWHRGTRELDLVLGPFADMHVDSFDSSELVLFEDLLLMEETDLQAILLGREPAPGGPKGELLAEIRDFHLQKASREARERL